MFLRIPHVGLAVAVLIAMLKCTASEPVWNTDQKHFAGVDLLETVHEPVWQTVPSLHEEEERERLIQRIERAEGKWDGNHPRWRILEALHGFDRYRDVAGAEIARFEGLYKHVPQKHKKVLATESELSTS